MSRMMRCLSLLLLATLLMMGCTPANAPEAAAYWPTAGWRTATPEEQGIDSARLAEALLTMRERNIPIHSLLIIRDGSVLLDAYFYPYDGGTVHDLASVTKSVMTTLIAIAADQGKLKLDQPMLDFFPERTLAHRDARMEAITVRDLVGMANGLESLGFAQDEGTLQAMQASEDFVQFALDRPVVSEPGTQFVYDSPGMHLLSAILQQATGMTAFEFAQQNLFEPLGIATAQWPADAQGVSDGWGDLRLEPRDVAKIGYLFLHGGTWDGQQIVSRTWVEDATRPHLPIEGKNAYGYGWWTRYEETGYSAEGRGGQSIKVEPDMDIVVVTTGGGFDYDDIDAMLTATVVDLTQPLPPNPEGVAQLEAAVAAIAAPPPAQPVAPLPAMAQQISGKTYVLEPNNPLETDTVSIRFDGSAEAVVTVKPVGGGGPDIAPVGLDGVFRLSPGPSGLPQGYRGYWDDEQSFVLEFDGIASNDHVTLRFTFADDRVLVQGQETSHTLGIEFEGWLQE